MRAARALIAPTAMLLVAAPLVVPSPAYADPTVRVSVTVERILLLAGDDGAGCGAPDWYVRVDLAGQLFDNEDTPSQDAFEGNDDISPGWEFARTLDPGALATPGQIPISVEVWEEDGFTCGSDERFDASAGPGDAVTGFATVAPCEAQLDGQVIGCATTGSFSGTADDRVQLQLRVVVQPPVNAPGLRVRCTHTPAWPQPGETVRIMAEALDGALAQVYVDDLEIWIQDDVDDLATRRLETDLAGVNVAYATFTAPGDDADGFRFGYACGLAKGSERISSGWRIATEGDPGTAVFPVVYTGPSSSRLDVVFIADDITYPFGVAPPAGRRFLNDVARVIGISYYGFDPFLTAQDSFNFWILTRPGSASDANVECAHDAPAGWEDEYAWADVGMILHFRSQRDCALSSERLASGTLNLAFRGDAFQIVTHETSHQPFGLADEYCNLRPGSFSPTCDGGYWMADVAPNVYAERDICLGELSLFADGRDADDCQEFLEPTDWAPDPDWTVSDPVVNDIMVDNGMARGADLRRYRYILDECRAAGC
ncbi:hypothetical protein [Agromyces arachidis]|uniref:hypothetical protein n=1 Tax=Agromyces arachidis TaxID=766966 RepID=UPI0040577ED8